MSGFCLAIALLGLEGAAVAQDSPEQLFRQAIALHQSGDMEGAIRQYQAYLKLQPDSPDALSNLGAALIRVGRYAEAIPEYQEALKLRPEDPRIRLNLALAYYKSGQISEAAGELSSLHAVEPGNQQVTLLLADCWLRQGENAQVVEMLTPLAEQNEDDLAVAYLLGTALLRNKQVERGQQMIDRILRNGDSAEAHLLLGTAKLEVLDYPAAIADFQKAVELNPDLPDVYAYLGRAQMFSGNMKEARDAFEMELARNPNNYESNLRLAVLLKGNGEYDRGQELLARALRVRPNDLRALYQVGAIDLAAGKPEKACATLEEVVERAPQFLEAHVSLAQAYYRLKRKADGDRIQVIVKKLRAERDVSEARGQIE